MAAKAITIFGISGRARRGTSRPFVCEGMDGHFYFVKSGNVAPEQLVKDYLFGRLAEECGLPVAPVRVVDVPEDLARYALVDRAEEFLPGPAFGSQRIPFGEEVRSLHLPAIDTPTKLRTLCFDWWTANASRRLDRVGGDSGLLWDPVLQAVFLIDHDGCLDPDFDPAEWKSEHPFRDAIAYLDRDFFGKFRTKFESAIYNLGSIWEEMPKEWLEDGSGTTRTSLTRPEVEAALIKPDLEPDGFLPI